MWIKVAVRVLCAISWSGVAQFWKSRTVSKAFILPTSTDYFSDFEKAVCPRVMGSWDHTKCSFTGSVPPPGLATTCHTSAESPAIMEPLPSPESCLLPPKHHLIITLCSLRKDPRWGGGGFPVPASRGQKQAIFQAVCVCNRLPPI